MSQQKVYRDRPFNPQRRVKPGWASHLVCAVRDELQDYEHRKGLRQRKRRPVDQNRFYLIVEALVADLAHRYLAAPEGRLTVPLSKDVLGREDRYGSPVYSKTLPQVLAHLASPELAFVELEKGTQNDFHGVRSTIWAGRRLRERIDHYGVELDDLRVDKGGECIVLKADKEDRWDTGKWIDYTDTCETDQFRSQMERINQWLAAADIDYLGEDEDDDLVDPSDRYLRRYFNNGSFSLGGRLFGGFWQPLKKAKRAAGIRINGERVVSLDYRQMAPTILYAKAGAAMPEGDAYTMLGWEVNRPGIKQVFNAMLNSEKPLTRFPMGSRPAFPRRARIADVVKRISDKHRAIARYFCSGVGLELMFIESQIMVDVLLRLIEKDITALPVHDAVVVGHSHLRESKEVMLRAFDDHLGVKGDVEIEGDHQGGSA